MYMASARRSLLAIATGVILTAASIVMAQEPPRVVPQPRPAAPTAPIADAAIPAAPDAASQATPVAPSETVAATTAAPSGPQVGPVTGFPIPRYVSLKASEANARRGPSRSHRIDWVFLRRNMPVMVVAEHGHWRRIIDRDGAGGWVHYTMLSGVRTVIVEADMLPIMTRPDPGTMVRAQAERDVIAEVKQCRAGWCEIEAGGYRGWVDAAGLWGVGPGETIE